MNDKREMIIILGHGTGSARALQLIKQCALETIIVIEPIKKKEPVFKLEKIYADIDTVLDYKEPIIGSREWRKQQKQRRF